MFRLLTVKVLPLLSPEILDMEQESVEVLIKMVRVTKILLRLRLILLPQEDIDLIIFMNKFITNYLNTFLDIIMHIKDSRTTIVSGFKFKFF